MGEHAWFRGDIYNVGRQSMQRNDFRCIQDLMKKTL